MRGTLHYVFHECKKKIQGAIASDYRALYELDMMTVGKRIAWFRERAGLKQLALAVACEPPLTQGAISHLETGKRPGRWDTLSRVAAALKLTIDDLFRPPPIPVIALAEAGVDGYHLDSYPPGGGFDYLERPLDVDHESAYAIEVKGDSMVPTLYEGWRVIAIPERPRSRCLAIIGLRDGQRLVKRVRYEHERVLLESSNPAYDPLVVTPADVEFLHRIVWIKPSQTPPMEPA